MNTDTIKDELETNAIHVNDFILSYLNGNPKELYRAIIFLVEVKGLGRLSY
jgi:hypothetical protein